MVRAVKKNVIGYYIILLPQGLGEGTHDCGAQVGYGICTRGVEFLQSPLGIMSDTRHLAIYYITIALNLALTVKVP